MLSPFSDILAPYTDQLPASFREQYLCPAGAPYQVVLGGQMQRVWHRPTWLYPVFWFLSKGDVFFPEMGENIPTTLIVSPGGNRHGDPVQTWERIFYFPNHVRRRYKSTMVYDASSKRIIELQGPKHIFAEIAEIRFSPPARSNSSPLKASCAWGACACDCLAPVDYGSCCPACRRLS